VRDTANEGQMAGHAWPCHPMANFPSGLKGATAVVRA
jgi:hypothetical protein